MGLRSMSHPPFWCFPLAERTDSVVAYYLFLMANALLFMRPQEFMPVLGDFQLYLVCIAGALVFGFHDLVHQLRWRTLVHQPVNFCVLGMLVAIVLSRATTGNFKELDLVLFNMVKVVLYYLLLVSVINTPQRFRTFLMTTVICATVMVAYSVVDYRKFCQEWEGNPEFLVVLDQERHLDPADRKILRHIPDRNGEDIYGNEIWFFRLCGLGVFHDPNDISLLIVATTIISVFFLTDPAQTGIRYLWIIPICINAVAMFYTYSRGGLLALGVGGLVWLITRYGTKVAIAIGVAGALVAPVILGRAANIDVSSGTGQQRIQLWSEGLQAIQGGKFFFGIGEGVYPELGQHVAHNSFVHSFVELGFFGGTIFMGCFFLPGLTIYLIQRSGFKISDPTLRRFLPYLAAILAEWCTGMYSLSRCYVSPTYMIAGLAASYMNLVGYYRPFPKPLIRLSFRLLQPWVAASAGLLAFTYVFIRLFARWS